MSLELVPLPTGDVDRSKDFYVERMDSTWTTTWSRVTG